MKNKSHVEDWMIRENSSGAKVLLGTIFNDSRFDPSDKEFSDGHHIVSSAIIEIREGEVETKNTIYTLGAKLDKVSDYWNNRANELAFFYGVTL